MNYLIVLNDPPYGTERSFNGLRLALWLSKREEVSVKVFLLSDSVVCVKTGQKLPSGYYNLEVMLKKLVARGVVIGACGVCMEARGLTDADLIGGVHKSNMDELTDWTLEADKVVVF